MYKLKNSYIDKMVSSRLSSKEIDFLLYIALYQSESGIVESVYYKDVCNSIGISIQKFYDILNSLSNKNLITYSKVNAADVRVTVCDNDFSNESYQKGSSGYLNVAQHNFSSTKFREMKAGSKLFYLYTQRFINGKHMLLDNFYEEFCALLGVVKKSLQQYIHELREKKLLFISKKRNKAYNYEISFRRSTVLFKDSFQMGREKQYYVDNIAALIRRNFKGLTQNSDDKSVKDIASLAEQERAKKYCNFISLIIDAIKMSVTRQKQEGKDKEKLMLNAALVNKCLSDVIERDICMKYGII